MPPDKTNSKLLTSGILLGLRLQRETWEEEGAALAQSSGRGKGQAHREGKTGSRKQMSPKSGSRGVESQFLLDVFPQFLISSTSSAVGAD